MSDFFTQYSNLLKEAKRPYQYIGEEMNSCTKEITADMATMCLIFPDKYEIGISNLGQRILYDYVNSFDKFYMDRAYAPDVDFKNILEKSGKLYYGHTSKKALNTFDLVAFSLQYEMAYPTVLKILELGGIEVKNTERKENSPIICAGGPCTYNPAPMSDFIDVFAIGDGEEVMAEILDVIYNAKKNNVSRIEILKQIAELEGCYVPQIHDKINKIINKRIVQLDEKNLVTNYPVPFSPSVHDRAVVEIRRGCGRMCRFCQPGHVNLPIRERNPQQIKDAALKILNNTGYDEYSLLSLSSNDYPNIENLLESINSCLCGQNISASLPSQRIDSFSVKIADLVNDVRKTAITLAPEAGSQRLRDVINKNLSEEQIVNISLKCYENGYNHLKYYFMMGLPTETYEDLDEMCNLLSKIRYLANQKKKELNLDNNLNITATVSIFVPKPHTPFQWCSQISFDDAVEKIKYLKEKEKHIKGVKLNIHDIFTSKLEALLTRADKSLNNFIYELYKNGSYLDAWSENFSKDFWKEIAQKCNVDIEKLTTQQFGLDDNLPWAFINCGIDDSWFKEQYNLAIKNTAVPTCETKCSNCGVCKNFKTHKTFSNKELLPIEKNEKIKQDNQNLYKYRIHCDKKAYLSYLSHLDWQNTFIKYLRKTDLKLAFSQGFNPMPKISMGIALPIFAQSECEYIDFETVEKYSADEIKSKLEKVIPEIINIFTVKEIAKNTPSLMIEAQWTKYAIKKSDGGVLKNEEMWYIKNVLSSNELYLEKKNKKGVDIKINVSNSVANVDFCEKTGTLYLTLKSGQGSDIKSIRADDFMELVFPGVQFDIVREKYLDIDLKEI